MATVTRSTVKPNPVAASPVDSAKPAALRIKLPTKPKPPSYDINDYHVLISGDPGTGKTTLGTQEDNVLNLSFDPINKSYFILQEPVPDWRTFQGWIQLLEKEAAASLAENRPFMYRRVQIDGIGIMSLMCQKAACINMGIAHPKDGDYGSGFDAVNTLFSETVDRLMALPCGVWWIAHSKDKELTKKDGRKVERTSADIKGKMEGILVGKCHMHINIQYLPGGSTSRLAIIRGDETTSAKCNINDRFLTTDGRQVEDIVLGNAGPKAAWEKFMRAFNNQQTWANYAEMLKMIAAQKARKAAAAKPPEEATE